MLVIRICSKEKGLSGKLKRGMGRILLEKRALREGHFYEMTVFSRADRIKWKKVRKALGGRPVCAVMGQGICPPAGCGITRFDSRDFRENLLFRTFRQAVESVRPAVVGIADPDGKWVEAAEALLPVVEQLRICTAQAVYADLLERSVAEYGTAPVISPDESVLRDGAAVYLPGESLPPAGCGAVFSQENGYGVEEAGLVLPEDVRVAIPEGISPLDFAAAAVEAGLLDGTEITCRALSKNGGMNSLRGICRQMT